MMRDGLCLWSLSRFGSIRLCGLHFKDVDLFRIAGVRKQAAKEEIAMTKRKIRLFFDNPVFEYDNGVWWRGNVGYLLFNGSLLTLFGRDTDKPALLLIQKLRDVSFLILAQKRGVIVGSRKMFRDYWG